MEILAAHQPALMRDAMRDWPAVRAGKESPHALANYLRGFDTGASADTMTADPAIDGYFFYDADMTGHNFTAAWVVVGALATTREARDLALGIRALCISDR